MANEKMSNEVYDAVKKQILRIDNGFDASGRATLAKLRRGVGKTPGKIYDIYEFTIGAIPANDEYADQAIHAALTLFALHRQGTDISGLNGGSFGSAVAKLQNGMNAKAVISRFNSVLSAGTVTELSVRVRSLIQLLRSNRINMDYPKFAQQLYFWQMNAELREKICLDWGRDFWKSSAGK